MIPYSDFLLLPFLAGVGACGRLPAPTLLIENFLFLQSSQIYLQKNYVCHNCDEFSHQREGTADIGDQF